MDTIVNDRSEHRDPGEIVSEIGSSKHTDYYKRLLKDNHFQWCRQYHNGSRAGRQAFVAVWNEIDRFLAGMPPADGEDLACPADQVKARLSAVRTSMLFCLNCRIKLYHAFLKGRLKESNYDEASAVLDRLIKFLGPISKSYFKRLLTETNDSPRE